MSIVAIDPGTKESAFVVWDRGLIDSGFVPNEVLLSFLNSRMSFLKTDHLAIEMVACYGMAVGKEVFETCVWIGRFIERARFRWKDALLVYRRDIKIHICGSMKAKDGNIRQALIDKYGPQGTKKAPGPTYGLSSHLWSALAVADYAMSQISDA